MSKIDNITRGEFEEFVREVRRNQYATPLNGASVGSGGMRFYGSGMLTVENQGLRVTGTAEVIGTLLASGTINLTGTVTVSGPLNVASGGKITAGSIELNPDGSAKFGTMLISPTGKITSGAAEINPDGSAKFGTTTISTTGKITSGSVSIDPSVVSGSLVFSNGSRVASTPNGAQIEVSGGGSAYVSATQAGIARGGIGIAVDASGPFISGMPTTTQPANLYQDPATGRIYRSTA